MFFQIGMKGDEESGKDRELLILTLVVVLFLLFSAYFCVNFLYSICYYFRLLLETCRKLGMEVPVFNPSTQKFKAGRYLSSRLA